MEETPSQEPEYVVISPEMNLTPKQKLLCREIARQVTKEVRLSQRQLLFLIGLLVAELEDRESMVALNHGVLAARTRLDDRQAIVGTSGELEVPGDSAEPKSGLVGI